MALPVGTDSGRAADWKKWLSLRDVSQPQGIKGIM